MDIGLGWLGVGVGLAGCLATYWMAVSAGDRVTPARSRAPAGLTVVLTLILWAITMQRRPPFSEGQALGLGFLIGGITGALAILLSSRFEAGSARIRTLATNSTALLALFGVSLTYSIFHGNPQDALIGFSIGAVMAAILGYYSEKVEDQPSALYIEAWAFFGVTLAAGVVLAVSHFNQSALRIWWPLPILLATTVCIASYVASELAARSKDRPAYGYSALVAAVLVIGLSAVYSWKIVSSWQLLEVAAVGIGVGAIAAWLSALLDRSKDSPGGLEISAVIILLVMAFVVVAFKLWSGLGIAIGLIAAWSLALAGVGDWGRDGVEESTSSTRPLSPVLSLGAVLLLFRLFIELHRGSLRGGDLRVHYTFVGAMLGVVIPFLLASSLLRLKNSNGGSRVLASVCLIGLLAAASPILLFLIWDVQVVTGLMFGLTAAVAFFLMVRLASDGESGILPCSSIALLVMGAQLVAIQFIRPLMEVELTRGIRIWTLGGTLVVLIIGLAITAFVSARRER